MSELRTIYGQRRRQVFIVLLMGSFGVLIASMMVVDLPGYSGLGAVTDGDVVHVVTQRRVLAPDEPQVFVVRRSVDGSTFDDPASLRSGRLASVLADNGAVYFHFHKGGVHRLKGGEWTRIPSGVSWDVLGIGMLDDNLTAFGQDITRGVIAVARPDNVAAADLGQFVEYDRFAYRGGKIIGIETAKAADGDYLVWVEAPGDNTLTTRDLVAARIADDNLDTPVRHTFEGMVDYSVVGRPSGLDVFWRDPPEAGGLVAASDDTLRKMTLTDGKWSEPIEVDVPRIHWMRSGPTSVVVFEDKTFIYTVDYWLGVLYAGTFGAELRGERASEKFMVSAPTNDELEEEVSWVLQAMTACFVAAGALGGLARLRHFESQRSPIEEQPLYATVTDRAAAAGFDFMLIFGILWFVTGRSGGTGPLDFWVSFIFLYAMYGAAMETVSRGQTLGKKLLGLRVLSVDGAQIAFASALQRNVLKFFEIITVGVGVCLMTRRFQRPGDFLAGTVVIKELRMPKPVGE